MEKINLYDLIYEEMFFLNTNDNTIFHSPVDETMLRRRLPRVGNVYTAFDI